MFAKIWSVIQTIRAVIDLFKQVRKLVKENQKNEIDRQKSERRQAIEDLKNAKTEEDFWNAQRRISRNSMQ